MSAIYGIVKPNDTLIESLYKDYDNYPYDRHLIVNEESYHVGCLHQWDTLTSENEVLPRKHKDIIINADILLDNRIPLMKELELDEASDSEIILHAYEKWGEDFVKYLEGDFVISIYDMKLKKFLLCTDHMGKRTVFYKVKGDKLIYSTLMAPIASGKISDRWLAYFVGNPTVFQLMDSKVQMYDDINYLAPASILIFKSDKVDIKTYWSPFDHPLEIKTFDEAVMQFKNLYEAAVKNTLRSNGNIGIMLSSGNDSSSVASIAARNSDQLNSYTSVPLGDYETGKNKYLEDESDLVKQILSMYPNIQSQFITSANTNAYDSIDEMLSIFKKPYKIIENGYWVNDIVKQAGKDNCKILLNGQYGNFTISYSNISIALMTYMKKYKFIKMFRLLNQYCKLQKRSSFRFLAKILLNVMNIGYKLHKGIFIVNPLLSQSFDKFYDVNNQLIKNVFDISLTADVDSDRKRMMNPIGLYQLGSMETIFSVHYGVRLRDPTREKKVVEFCFNVPFEYYIYKGNNRALFKEAMKEYLPDTITSDEKKKGHQAADWIHRLKILSSDIDKEFNESLHDSLQPVISKQYSDKISEHSDKLNSSDLKTKLMVIILNRFYNK